MNCHCIVVLSAFDCTFLATDGLKTSKIKNDCMKKFLLILLVLAVGFQESLLAQTRTVTGTVTGGDDGLGIPRANILVKGSIKV